MPKLLIVEDAVDIQMLLRRLFEMEGYQVRCASNGQEALFELTNSDYRPDLILLDLMMPVMDGFEFREQQMKIDAIRDIPIVVMTADGDIQPKRSSLDALGFLRKPVDIDNLLTTVEKHCKTAASLRAGPKTESYNAAPGGKSYG